MNKPRKLVTLTIRDVLGRWAGDEVNPQNLFRLSCG